MDARLSDLVVLRENALLRARTAQKLADQVRALADQAKEFQIGLNARTQVRHAMYIAEDLANELDWFTHILTRKIERQEEI